MTTSVKGRGYRSLRQRESDAPRGDARTCAVVEVVSFTRCHEVVVVFHRDAVGGVAVIGGQGKRYCRPRKRRCLIRQLAVVANSEKIYDISQMSRISACGAA